MKRRPLVVELVGPAGAGKSALSRVLSQRDKTVRAGLSVWRLSWLFLVINTFLLLPTLLRLYRKYRWFLGGEIKQIVRLRTLYQLLRRETSRNCRAVILEEGPVFALSWLQVFAHESLRSPDFEKWRRAVLSQWARIVDVIIWLDTTDPILAHRIRIRGQWHPVKDKPDQTIYEFLEGYRACFAQVISQFTAEGGLKTIKFDTHLGSVDQIADEVLAILEGEWGACRRFAKTG